MERAGYSGTPLAKKLGIKNGYHIRLVNPPANYFSLFDDMPADIKMLTETKSEKHLIHYFATRAEELHKDILSLKKEIAPNGIIWVSWPKKASKLPTDVTEDVIRKLALANGLVD